MIDVRENHFIPKKLKVENQIPIIRISLKETMILLFSFVFLNGFGTGQGIANAIVHHDLAMIFSLYIIYLEWYFLATYQKTKMPRYMIYYYYFRHKIKRGVTINEKTNI